MTSRKNSLFLKFLISYILILIVSIVIALISYVRSAQVIKSQMEKYNEVILKQVQQVIDERLSIINKNIYDISLNPRVLSFMYSTSDMGNEYYYNMSQAVKELSQGRAASSFIYNTYLYHTRNDIIVNASSRYDTQFYFDEISPYHGMEYDQWKRLLSSINTRTYIPNQPINIDGKTKNIITCLDTLPMYPKDKKLGTLAILLDVDNMIPVLNNSNILDKGAVYIIDDAQTIMLSLGNKNLIDQNLSFPDYTNYFYNKINGIEAIVTFIPSTSMDWTYVSVIPTSIFMNNVYKTRNITFALIGIMLIIGVILALVSASSNFRPIKNILDLLQQNLNTNSIFNDSKNEMDFIEKVTLMTVKENSLYNREKINFDQ